VRDQRGRALAADRAHLLAQRVVGAHRQRLAVVEVAAGPRLDARVDVERVDLAAQRISAADDTSTDRLTR
jgi:hypothetical protein